MRWKAVVPWTGPLAVLLVVALAPLLRSQPTAVAAERSAVTRAAIGTLQGRVALAPSLSHDGLLVDTFSTADPAERGRVPRTYQIIYGFVIVNIRDYPLDKVEVTGYVPPGLTDVDVFADFDIEQVQRLVGVDVSGVDPAELGITPGPGRCKVGNGSDIYCDLGELNPEQAAMFAVRATVIAEPDTPLRSTVEAFGLVEGDRKAHGYSSLDLTVCRCTCEVQSSSQEGAWYEFKLARLENEMANGSLRRG